MFWCLTCSFFLLKAFFLFKLSWSFKRWTAISGLFPVHYWAWGWNIHNLREILQNTPINNFFRSIFVMFISRNMFLCPEFYCNLLGGLSPQVENHCFLYISISLHVIVDWSDAHLGILFITKLAHSKMNSVRFLFFTSTDVWFQAPCIPSH